MIAFVLTITIIVLIMQEEYKQAGMNDYLSKPIDMEQICEKVKKWT